MAVQPNNLLLLELDASTGLRGLPRTLSTTDELQLNIADIDFNTSGTIDIATGGSVLDLQGPNINIGTLTSGSAANLTITIGQPASVLTLTGTVLYLDFPVYFRGSTVGIQIEAGENLASGDVVTIYTLSNPTTSAVPRMVKAECDAGTDNGRIFTGVVTSNTITTGNQGYAATITGTVVPVTFKATDLPTLGSVGSPVYVSDEAGKAQMTAPSTSGQTIYRIGMLVSETAVSGVKYAVQLQPQLIAELL